jgi:hypothetical protein
MLQSTSAAKAFFAVSMSFKVFIWKEGKMSASSWGRVCEIYCTFYLPARE